jgi:hypothetical protein
MISYNGGQFLATWKNSPQDEDQPGQRILYSQSLDGNNWTPTDGRNIIFPNVSTNNNPAALFAEPTLAINDRFYAAASPQQFCLYGANLWQDQLLLRRVFTPGLHNFGPLFWAANTIPAGFELVSATLGIKTLNQTDTQTRESY